VPFPRGLSQDFSLRCTKDRKVAIAVTVLAVMLLLTVAIIVLAGEWLRVQESPKRLPGEIAFMSHLGMLCLFSAKKHPHCTTPALPSCLENGIGFGNKCFYFLEEEVDWEGSQHSCLSRQAHLATIDTKEELNFLLRNGNFMEYWVGLWREGSGPWKWLNGSLFNA
ncbi:CL2D2 protein, partial [Acrocephalus arundinaceus]|nr:CL2D2 protein [Acrocephalus arundinaceus]